MRLRTTNLNRINDSEGRAALAREFMATAATRGLLRHAQLAPVLGVQPKTVLTWQRGEKVPMRKLARRMLAILESGAWPEPPAPPEGEDTP